MTVGPATAAAVRRHADRNLFFCAEECARKFDDDPGPIHRRDTARAIQPRPPLTEERLRPKLWARSAVAQGHDRGGGTAAEPTTRPRG
jgi:YHS domain-containing protein